MFTISEAINCALKKKEAVREYTLNESNTLNQKKCVPITLSLISIISIDDRFVVRI